MKQPQKLLAAALAVTLTLGSVGAQACTGLYVGKDVSAEGATIIARSEDISPADYDKLHMVVPHSDEAGRYLEDINGFKMPLPDTTYQYTAMSDYASAGDGVYYAVCTNEMGVSVTGTVSASPCAAWKEADPRVEEGLREAVLPALVAATAATAKQGVDNLLAAVDAYGSAEGNVVMIADQSEAWIVEIYGGHEYAAMKMPADQVAVFGNQFMIGAVDPEDTENYVLSENLLSTIDALGLAVKDADGKYLAAQSVCDNSRSDGSNMRTWIGHQLFAPSTAGDYATDTFYPLFYAPDRKISLSDVMAVYRSRYEGTEYDMSLEGNEGGRPIAVSTTPETHIIQIFDDYPAACSAVTWLAMGGAEHSVFLPEFSGITETAPAFRLDAPTYAEGSAYWAFKRICGLADTNRALYTQGVQDFWTLQEQAMIAQMEAAGEEMKTLYAADPAQGASYVTNLAQTMLADQMAKSNRLYASLLTVLTHNVGLSAAKTPTAFVASTPLREAAQLKGYTMGWNGAEGAVTLTKDGVTYALTLGSKTCKKGTEEITLTRAPYAEDGVTYVPVDFVKGL